MTKQEETREEIAIQCYTNAIMVMLDQKIPLEPVDWDELLINQKEFYRKQADDTLRVLNGKDVVIKVDRDLPHNIYGNPKDYLSAGCFHHAQIDMIEAGYVAVEPLIKNYGEVKGENRESLGNAKFNNL